MLGPFKNVSAFNSKISPLEIRSDDIAELIVTMKNGVVASIRTDIFGRKHEKKLELKGTKGNISWDFYKEISIYNSKNKKIKMIKNFLKTLIQTILMK